MKTTTHKTERLHALDSLRAIMMMLGIVLHSSNTYVVADYGASWPLKDVASTSLTMDWISSFVHAFRMPIFFVVAGFFAALLFYERSYSKMIKNRIDRILLPLLVFVVVLWPLVNIGFSYSNLVIANDPTPFASTLANFSEFAAFIPGHTMHLWFLYYLVLFSATSYILGLIFKSAPQLSGKISNVFSRIIQKPLLKLLVFSLVTFLLLLVMDRTWVATSLSWVPDFNTYIFYAFFYFFGWILFKSKAYLSSFLSYDWLFTIVGLMVFTGYFLSDTSNVNIETIMAIKAITVWLFIFGMTGLFIRYTSNHSPIMRYVSDSSYWVYLLHLPLTALLPGFLVGFALPGILKFVIVATCTAFVCLMTYHFLIRPTFIGKFLNGRKYPRRIHVSHSEKTIRPQVSLDK
jgi:peptidoglycan/LPS O-acetylase OafA/YrhL